MDNVGCGTLMITYNLFLFLLYNLYICESLSLFNGKLNQQLPRSFIDTIIQREGIPPVITGGTAKSARPLHAHGVKLRKKNVRKPARLFTLV